MGKKITTKKNLTIVKKVLLYLILFLFTLAPITTGASLLDQKRAELERLTGRIDEVEAVVEDYTSRANTLKNQIAGMNAQIIQLQLKIKLTQTKIEETNLAIGELQDQIYKKKKELAVQKEILGQAIKYIYEEGETPFVETFFSSMTFSEILDRTEYLSTAETKIEKAMASMERLRQELEDKKQEQEKKKKGLTSLNKDLSLQRQGLEKDRFALVDQGVAEAE